MLSHENIEYLDIYEILVSLHQAERMLNALGIHKTNQLKQIQYYYYLNLFDQNYFNIIGVSNKNAIGYKQIHESLNYLFDIIVTNYQQTNNQK